MGKSVKIVLGLIGALVVLVIAAIIVIPMMVDPNDYKPQIVAAVKKQTGRDLSISGDLELTVFPWIGVTTGLIELGNAPGFDGDVFARLEKVNARVKLMPLLSSEVEMDTVNIHGLVLNLARKADGSNNWDDLAAGSGEESAPSESSDGTSPIGALAIGGLDLQNAALSWDDAQAGQQYKISNLNATTGTLSPGKPVDLNVSFDLAGGPPDMTGQVSLTGTVEADLNAQKFDVSGLKLKVGLSGKDFPDGQAKLSVAADASADLGAGTAALRSLVVKALGLEATGNLDVTQLNAEPQLSGQIEVATFDPKKMLKRLGQPPIETADPKALTALSLRTGIGGSASNIALSDLQIKLDETTLSGAASYGSLLGFDLKVDAIDADRYLPPAQDPAASTPGAAAGAASDLPVEALRAVNADGTLAIGKLKISNLNLSEISLTLKAKDGDIRLNPIAAKLYDGSYSGNIRLDARQDTPKLSVNEKLSSVQAGPLLTDLVGEERLVGTANIEAKLNAVGANPEAMKKTLSGTAAFAFTDGAINGVNIAAMIRNAAATILGGKEDANAPKRTDFAELGGTAQIKNGLVTNNDFAAKSPLLRIDGKGTVNLPTEAIDYKVKATLVASTEGQGGKELSGLNGVPIPVTITGTFAEPAYGLDTAELTKIMAKAKIGNLVEGSVGNIGKDAGKLLEGGTEGAGKLLEGGTEGAGKLLEGTGEAAGGLLEGVLGN